MLYMEEIMPVVDLDIIVAIAQEKGVSLYEAESQITALLAREEEGE